MSFLAVTRATLEKDVRLEWRSKDAINAMLFFALLVVNGTFFAAISIRTRAREIMLPLLLFPLSIPALLAMVSATTSVLTGEESARFWIALLVAYDVVFTMACLLLFETVLEAE